MPKCRVTDGLGEVSFVEANFYDVLLDSGYVVLKRRIQPDNPESPLTTSAILHKPLMILFDQDANVEGTIT